MTSRRSFLGLLAAAPLAAPLIAKAAAEPNLISGMAVARGETINITVPISLAKGGYIRLPPHGQWRFKDWSRVSHTLDFDTGEISVSYEPPNRLHGVAVNADGDAI